MYTYNYYKVEFYPQYDFFLLELHNSHCWRIVVFQKIHNLLVHVIFYIFPCTLLCHWKKKQISKILCAVPVTPTLEN